MKIALLIPVTDTNTGKEFWTWMTPSEKVISKEFNTKKAAILEYPIGYTLKDDGWNNIIIT